MKKIWKFNIPGPTIGSAFVDYEIPGIPKFLDVQIQKGEIQAWALVDKEDKERTYRFEWVGTGHPIDFDPGLYLKTMQFAGGLLVLHLFVREVVD